MIHNGVIGCDHCPGWTYKERIGNKALGSGKKKIKKNKSRNKGGSRASGKAGYDAKAKADGPKKQSCARTGTVSKSHTAAGTMAKADAKGSRAGNRQARKNGSGEIGVTDYAASAAGILMCLLTAFMLFADLFAHNPDRQYELYPAAFKVADVCAVIAGIACFSMILRDRKRRDEFVRRMKRERTWIFFAVFLLCIFISTCINGLDSKAIHGMPYRNIGVFNLAAFILFYMGASAFIRAGRMRLAYIVSFAAVADLIALSALYEVFAGDIIAYHAKKELSAVFFNGNHYGYFLTAAVLTGIGLVIYTDGWQMWLGSLTSLLNLLVLGINHSLGCMMAVILVTAVSAVIIMRREPERRKRVYMVVSAASAVFAAALICIPEVRSEFAGFLSDAGNILSGNARGSEGHNRLKIWNKTWKYIMEKPLFGYGCEGISERLYIASAISNPHNEIITYAAYYGIPAAIAYTAGVLSVLIRSIQRKHFSDAWFRIACLAACGYFVSSLTGVAMFYLTPFFFIFLGMSISGQ